MYYTKKEKLIILKNVNIVKRPSSFVRVDGAPAVTKQP